MKNLFKIFFAVVAFVAYSCATDTTGDLDVQLGNGEGQTIIALSLEESRTQLGEKAGDLYPVYWSEGDKISVNGVESSEADIDESDKTKAYFKVQGVIEAPYYVAYPVAPAGQVLFATEQVHTENTFGNGVSTMYGISATGTSTTLNHLTGVLKVGVTGNATITKAQISTANHAPIAGAFDIDFKNGKLTPSKDSAYTISYLFGEGVALSDEPVYMHIAVPAGVYDELYITLFDNQGGAMYATVKAGDEKPLAVGKVREFKNNIPYKSANYLLINDEASLREFAAQAADLDKDVLLTADIDMTNKEWTPINGFEKVFNGNGHAIKGLSAPFFGVISGSIKSLNLEDVDITLDTPYNDGENTWAYAGALALRINGGNLSYCSTSGKIEVNMEYDNTAASNSSNYNINLAGMVGLIDAATITSCVNRVNLTVKKIFSPAAERTYYTNCGGMFGSCLGTITMNDCHNYGSATLKTTDKTTVATLRFGGIVGFTNGTFKPTNSSNNGDLTLGNLRADNQDNAGSLYVGSITGHAGGATTMTSCTTASAITLEKSVSAVANYYVGPLVGSTAKNITISQCHTYNNAQGKGISLSGSCNQLYTGIVGKPAASSSTAYTHTLTNSSNNTDLLCTSDFKSSSTTYPTGGFSDTVSNAFSNWTITNCEIS